LLASCNSIPFSKNLKQKLKQKKKEEKEKKNFLI
jgi:hypothetical protein